MERCRVASRLTHGGLETAEEFNNDGTDSETFGVLISKWVTDRSLSLVTGNGQVSCRLEDVKKLKIGVGKFRL
jgi:hypothetical protein